MIIGYSIRNTVNSPLVTVCGEADSVSIGTDTVPASWDSAGSHCKPRPEVSNSRRENRLQTDAGRLWGGRAADC